MTTAIPGETPQADMPINPVQMVRSELLDALASGAVVATGNARLARSLGAEFDRRMLAQGRTAWGTPAVLPWSAWLLELYAAATLRSAVPLPRVLSAEQEELVWASAIRADGPRLQQALLRVDATARRARASWKLLCEWQLELEDGRFGHHENAEAFRRWARRFKSQSQGRGEVREADVPALLLPLLGAGACALPPRLLLAGFYELTPAQQALVTALRVAGCQADWAELRGQPGRARRLRADDARHEMRLAAGWARQILREQPQARIGIVAPDLAARRSALAQVLGQFLDPAALAPGAAPAPRPWNLSLGRPLSEQPVVATALRLLGLMQQPGDAETLGVLLLSPHWALPRAPAERRAELDRRALLDRRIRELGDTRLRLSNLHFLAGGREERAARPWHSPLLGARLGALLEASRQLPARATTGGWAATFTVWLNAAGWGAAQVGEGGGERGHGGRPLDSHEFQAVEAWNALLSRFSSLTDFAGSLSAAAALVLLGRLASETLFQPRGADAPVQVLGLYEAIGQSFDYLWVMGLHDGAWPAAAAPDPFIPLALQRERGLPHSGPELELAWAARVTGQLCAAAAEVVLSYPARDGNENLGCSPLIAALPELAAAGLPGSLESRWHLAIRASDQPEAAPAPAPVGLQNPDVRGGSRVLGDQAACPFRAFATHRLGARPLERPQAGLDAARKGSLLHRVLERLWQDLQSQAQLLALDEAALLGLLRGRIGEVLEEQRRRSPATFTERFRALEARRLEERVLAWLDLERRRSPFTLAASEQLRRFETGGLRLGVKIDRVDRLPDGALVVLDYKTGKVRPSAWFGARPEEPQLPLYGVVSRGAPEGGEIAAVAFAQIRPDRVGFSGVVRGAGVLPGLPAARKGELREASEHWPAVLDAWAEELERLAAAFRAGEAAVDPKRGLKTCEASFCELAPLCRVREILPVAGITDEDDPTENADDADDADE